MPVLTDPDRATLFTEFMRESSRTHDGLPLTKAELRAAVDAIDAWVDANAATFNTAIPQPARGALTSKQKGRLLAFVVQRRFEIQ